MTHWDLHTPVLAESILETIREPLLVLDRDLRVKTASRYFYHSFLVPPEETEGVLLYDLGNGQWNIPRLRDLLGRIVSEDSSIEGFEVQHDFPTIGWKTFLLNARRIQSGDGPIDAILLAFEDITERKAYEAELKRLALTDPLTGLANRSRFSSALDSAIKEGRRFEFGASLLLIDLDDFKRVNDTLGHPAGDVLLKDVAALLTQDVREVDTVSRLGGDEFAVVLVGTNTKEDAERLAHRYVRTLSRPFDIEGQTVTIGASIGIAHFPADADNVTDMLRRADLALYKAKKDGRNTHHSFTPDLEK